MDHGHGRAAGNDVDELFELEVAAGQRSRPECVLECHSCMLFKPFDTSF